MENWKNGNDSITEGNDTVTEGTYTKFHLVRLGTEKTNYEIIKHKYVLITVNPKEGTSVEDLYELYNRVRKKVWIQKTYGCFEWRGLDTGLHFHMLAWVLADKPKCHMHREVYNTVKSVVGNKKHVNIQVNKTTPDGMISYVDGRKKGQWKDNHETDCKMRDKYGMLPIVEWSDHEDVDYYKKINMIEYSD